MESKLIKLANGNYTLYDSDGDIVASNDPKRACSKKLSKQNCDEIFGAIDVERLANETFTETNPSLKEYEEGLHIGFKEGFLKAMELNKDKLFTVDDVRKAMSAGLSIGYGRQFEIENKSVEIDSYIQSLQQPKEIEVEIVMENYGYCEGCNRAGMLHCAHADSCGYAITLERQKLDENSCLILKRK